MTELKITATQTREHYHVEYECGCYRNALNGGISSMICKEGHIYSGRMIKLECRCWDAYGGPRWCENHLKFHKEAKIREELYFAKNHVRQLEKQLEKLKQEEAIKNIDHRKLIDKIE